MATKHQKITINLPGFDDSEKAAIATEIIDYIIKRTQDGKGKTGRAFSAKYSQEYVKSLDFKNAGKSKGLVDLTLSGDMLNSLAVLGVKKRSVVIGFEDGSNANAKADGNIRGTYGQDDPNPKKARDFLGIEPKALEKILSKYDSDPNRADRILKTQKAADILSQKQINEFSNDEEA